MHIRVQNTHTHVSQQQFKCEYVYNFHSTTSIHSSIYYVVIKLYEMVHMLYMLALKSYFNLKLFKIKRFKMRLKSLNAF